MAVPSVWSHVPIPTLEDSKAVSEESRVVLKYQPADWRGVKRQVKMSKLFLVNIPYNCSERELQEWVESRGFETRSIRIVRDLVAGVSPAFGYVELQDDTQTHEAIDILNGKRMRNQTILVKEAQVQTTGATGGGLERRTA